MHQIEFFPFMEVDNILIFHVLEGKVSRCKDGQMGTIYMNTYYLLNKKKLKLKQKCIFNTVVKYISNRLGVSFQNLLKVLS